MEFLQQHVFERITNLVAIVAWAPQCGSKAWKITKQRQNAVLYSTCMCNPGFISDHLECTEYTEYGSVLSLITTLEQLSKSLLWKNQTKVLFIQTMKIFQKCLQISIYFILLETIKRCHYSTLKNHRFKTFFMWQQLKREYLTELQLNSIPLYPFPQKEIKQANKSVLSQKSFA